MPRFVVLHHHTPAGYPRPTHFDLMLEQGDALRTWALVDLPSPGTTVAADQLPDHRPAYLDYEGEVAGNRGSVGRVDTGEYQIVSETMNTMVATLRGNRLRGTLTFTCEDPTNHRWRVAFSAG